MPDQDDTATTLNTIKKTLEKQQQVLEQYIDLEKTRVESVRTMTNGHDEILRGGTNTNKLGIIAELGQLRGEVVQNQKEIADLKAKYDRLTWSGILVLAAAVGSLILWIFNTISGGRQSN